MSLILGIDQGSTHTRAAICDEQGNIMGIGYADGASHTYDGIQTAMQRVRKASRRPGRKLELIRMFPCRSSQE